MELMEAIRAGLKELVLPEIDKIRIENTEIKAILVHTSKRIDDINLHLADQSRRIDETNKRIDETNKRIDETNKRIDESNKRIDELRIELSQRIDETNKRIDDTNKRIDETSGGFNARLDRLFEVIVRRDEHRQVVERLTKLEWDMDELKRKVAA